jgi:hypothetical protein
MDRCQTLFSMCCRHHSLVTQLLMIQLSFPLRALSPLAHKTVTTLTTSIHHHCPSKGLLIQLDASAAPGWRRLLCESALALWGRDAANRRRHCSWASRAHTSSTALMQPSFSGLLVT